MKVLITGSNGQLGKALVKLKAYAKKDVIQLIHQIVKDNVLDRIQNRELKDIRNLLIDKENQNIINVTDY